MAHLLGGEPDTSGSIGGEVVHFPDGTASLARLLVRALIPEWPPGEAPHEIARRPFGNMTIANSDAGPLGMTHTAIDEAWRAISELRN